MNKKIEQSKSAIKDF